MTATHKATRTLVRRYHGAVIVLLATLTAATWVTLLLVAPLLPGPAGAAVYAVGSFICHQIPERSFALAGAQLPVCARCLGLYAGGALGVASCLLAKADAIGVGSRRSVRRLAATAALPTVVTVALEVGGVWSSSNLTRALAGVPFGWVVGLVVVAARPTLHYGRCEPPRPIAPNPPPPPT